MVALAPRKSRVAVMTGPLRLDSLQPFLDGLLSGKTTTAPLQVRRVGSPHDSARWLPWLRREGTWNPPACLPHLPQ